MPKQMHLTAATKSAPMLGVAYRNREPTGEVITLEEGAVFENFAPGEILDHSPEGGMPIWYEWRPGRKIECIGVYPYQGGLIAVYGARWTGLTGREEESLERMKILTGVLTDEFRAILEGCRREAVARWGVGATEDVIRTMANRIVVEALDETPNWPDATEAFYIAIDSARMIPMSPVERLVIRLACFGTLEDDGENRARVLDLARATFDAVFRDE